MPKSRIHISRALILQAFAVLFGEILNVLAFRSLIVPAKLLSGGVVGTAMLFNQLFNLPIGLQTLIYNIPIFVLGYRYLGRRFVLLSMVGVGSFSILLDNISVPIITRDLLLIAVFGGVVTGIADGIIIRSGGSTGGLDIIGVIISRRFGISVGQVFIAFNGVIIALAAVFNKQPELAMYTLIMLFVSSRVVDVMQSSTPRRVTLIISAQHEAIAARIHTDLQRGVTYLQGSGAYTAAPYQVMMCVITRYELNDIRRIVQEIDAGAFMVILEASDVMGQFEPHSPFRNIFSNR